MGGTPNMTDLAQTSNASSPAPRRQRSNRRILVELSWVLLVLVIAGTLSMVRYQDPHRIASSGDSYWYMRQAQIFVGTDPATASARSSVQVCRDINRSARDQNMRPTCRDGYPQQGISPRYIAIFDTRPGYPLFAAPFVKVLGVWPGMAAATLIIAVAVGLLTYLAVWLALGIRLVGVGAAALIYLLPTGLWITRMLADGAMLAGCLAVLIGAMLLWRHRFSGLPIALAGFAWTFATKSANGVTMALVLLVASILALLTRFPNRRGAVLTGGLGLVAVVGWFALSAALKLPGLNETIQDFATTHFSRPDIPDPYTWLWEKNLEWWPGTLEHLLLSPLPLIAVVLATLILAVRARHVTFLWLGTGLTGLVVLAAHPVSTEWERLMIPVWFPVAAALSYAIVAALPARWSGRPAMDGAALPGDQAPPAAIRPDHAGRPVTGAGAGPARPADDGAGPVALPRQRRDGDVEAVPAGGPGMDRTT